MQGTKPEDKIRSSALFKRALQGDPDSINAIRKKWGVSKPEYCKYPSWLRPAVSAAVKRGDLPKQSVPLAGGWYALYHAMTHLGGDWVDHAGRVILDDGTHIYVSEPYQLLDSGKEQLERFCEFLGLTYTVSPKSWWVPGRTLRIELRRAEDR